MNQIHQSLYILYFGSSLINWSVVERQNVELNKMYNKMKHSLEFLNCYMAVHTTCVVIEKSSMAFCLQFY